MRIRLFVFLAIVASTTTSHARPGTTCAAACNRLSSCKLIPSRRACMSAGDKAPKTPPGARDEPGPGTKLVAALAA